MSANPAAAEPRASAASTQLDYSAMLRGLAERTPGAERVAGPAAEPGGAAAATDELSALLRGLAGHTMSHDQGPSPQPEDLDGLLQT